MLNGLMWLAIMATPLSTDVYVSPAVKAVFARHRTGGPEAESELRTLLAAGDRTAAVVLAELMMHPSRPGGPDLPGSCRYAEAAGDQPEALHNLANCYDNGLGKPRDKAKARALYGKASDLGFAKAACALGNLLISGAGGPADVPRGLDLCRRAADSGDPDAQTDYGGYLLLGRYMPKDAAEARRYLTLAAARKHRNAAFILGQIYWNGDGVAKDKAEAARWWLVAHEAGREDAALMLGLEAADRIGAALEAKVAIPAAALIEARRWLAIAAEKHPDPASRRKAANLLASLAELAPPP